MTFSKIRDCLKRFANDDTGATAVEYAIIAGGISVALALVIYVLGDTVFGKYEAVENVL